MRFIIDSPDIYCLYLATSMVPSVQVLSTTQDLKIKTHKSLFLISCLSSLENMVWFIYLAFIFFFKATWIKTQGKKENMLFLKNNLQRPKQGFKQAGGWYALLRSKAHTSELHPAVVMLSHAWIGSFTATLG